MSRSAQATSIPRTAFQRLGLARSLLREIRMFRMTSMMVTIAVVGCGATGDYPVWSASVTELTLSSAGGGPIPPTLPSPGCPYESSEYKLAVVDLRLDAVLCIGDYSMSDPQPLRRNAVSRVLSQVEFDGLVPVLEALKVVHLDTCGADKPSIRLKVTRNGHTTEYRDAFYSCERDDPWPRVESAALDQLFQVFGELAFSVNAD